ncbi:deoxyribonuclease IV [Candidatus Epulonipiscium viviparus]|uniref:deoxyribonuclease IV n=1 Tax=Candidatus Epulonipiscium viviparus TaxID=420336 RepID=UPI00273807B9|nr:deoxyribonuclease IV [Candidatus Epulopiscium viviparus]
MLKIGSHVSMSNGLIGAAEEAWSYGANTFMIYTGAPQNTRRSPIEKLKIKEGQEFMKAHGISDIVVHAPYIINLAAAKEDTYAFAKEFLKLELARTKTLGSEYLVIHPGAYTSATLDEGIDRIVAAINSALQEDGPTLLLETMSGKGTEIGKNFHEIKRIIAGVIMKNKIGVCFDTCHLHDSGYDIVEDFDGVLKEFDELVGKDYIKVVHLNGSINVRGAKKDRHANLGADRTNPRGEDKIGITAIKKIVANPICQNIPLILETPWLDKNTNLYKEEIELLRGN